MQSGSTYGRRACGVGVHGWCSMESKIDGTHDQGDAFAGRWEDAQFYRRCVCVGRKVYKGRHGEARGTGERITVNPW